MVWMPLGCRWITGFRQGLRSAKMASGETWAIRSHWSVRSDPCRLADCPALLSSRLALTPCPWLWWPRRRTRKVSWSTRFTPLSICSLEKGHLCLFDSIQCFLACNFIWHFLSWPLLFFFLKLSFFCSSHCSATIVVALHIYVPTIFTHIACL